MKNSVFLRNAVKTVAVLAVITNKELKARHCGTCRHPPKVINC